MLREAAEDTGKERGAFGVLPCVTQPVFWTDMPRQTRDSRRLDLLEAPAPIERSAEIAALTAAVENLGTGRGGVVLVEAQPGLGKSDLLEHAADKACGDGHVVRYAAPMATEREYELGVLRSLLAAPLRDHVPGTGTNLCDQAGGAARALLLDGDAPAPGSLHALAHGVFSLVAELSREQPLALIVDDAQWADDWSLATLSHLARRVDEVPLLILVAYRPGDPRADTHGLALLAATPGATTLRPLPLSGRGAARLVRRFAPAASDDDCRSAEEQAGGNPWLLGLLGAVLARDGEGA